MDYQDWSKLIFLRARQRLELETYYPLEVSFRTLLFPHEVAELYAQADKLHNWLISLEVANKTVSAFPGEQLAWYEINEALAALYKLPTKLPRRKIDRDKQKDLFLNLRELVAAYEKYLRMGDPIDLNGHLMKMASKWIINNAAPSQLFRIGHIRDLESHPGSRIIPRSPEELSEILAIFLQ